MMPPLRPLEDLCLISVFKMMPPNEQLVASLMSPRCAVLVRAANRKLKTLVITSAFVATKPAILNYDINHFSLASKPAMQQLMDTPGEPFPDYPMTTTRLSKWNCLVIDFYPLEQIDTVTTEQITNAFSAVTDLKFIFKNRERLIALLQHPSWQCQLTSLMICGIYSMNSQLAHELITAVNGLTALQHLALDWANDTNIPDLSILAQLKVIVFESNDLQAFVLSLERNAIDNDNLQIHLHSHNTKSLLNLSQSLHSRIVRFGEVSTYSEALLLCNQFRSLTSLLIRDFMFTEVVQLFTALSQLYQLVHLEVCLSSKEELPPEGPMAQLKSLRALELDLVISSHSDIEWFNLPVTMPNLKTIYIKKFSCYSCQVVFNCNSINFSIEPLLLSSSKALNCFKSSLFALHSGVSMNRFILVSGKKDISAAELLLHSQ